MGAGVKTAGAQGRRLVTGGRCGSRKPRARVGERVNPKKVRGLRGTESRAPVQGLEGGGGTVRPEGDRGRGRCRDGRRGWGGAGWGGGQPRYSHLQDAVPLAHPGPVGRPPGQHGAHMLQRRVQLAVDAPQLPALAHLAPHVEAVAGLGLDDAHDPRAAASPAAVPGAVEPGSPTAAATSVSVRG